MRQVASPYAVDFPRVRPDFNGVRTIAREIRRPVITLVTMLAIVVFGLFSLFSLDTDEYPEINPPVVSIAIPYPGASPDVVEREVINPIEEALTAATAGDLSSYVIEVTFDDVASTIRSIEPASIPAASIASVKRTTSPREPLDTLKVPS